MTSIYAYSLIAMARNAFGVRGTKVTQLPQPVQEAAAYLMWIANVGQAQANSALQTNALELARRCARRRVSDKEFNEKVGDLVVKMQMAVGRSEVAA